MTLKRQGKRKPNVSGSTSGKARKTMASEIYVGGWVDFNGQTWGLEGISKQREEDE